MLEKKSQKHQANFLISVRVLKILKKSVPPRKQSIFVEKAIEKALKKERFLNIIDEVAGAWEGNSHMSTEKFIRSLREAKRP